MFFQLEGYYNQLEHQLQEKNHMISFSKWIGKG